MNYEKIDLLLELERFDEAEQEARKAIAEDPDDCYATFLLGLALSRNGKPKEAEHWLRRTIELDPEYDIAFAQLAMVLSDRNQHKAAFEAIEEAILIDPEDASHFGIKAMCLYDQEQFSGVLEATETGLSLDPEDSLCRQFRSLALKQLGDTDAADEEALFLLDQSPDDLGNHLVRGLILMETDVQRAETHFLEALRIDPNSEAARDGLAQAMKIQNPVFGWLMRIFLWLGKFSFWGILIGIALAYQLPRLLALTNIPGFAEFGMILRRCIVVICVVSGALVPLFDFMLYLTNRGRSALSPSIQNGMKWIATCWLLGAGFAIAYLIDHHITSIIEMAVWFSVAGLLYETFQCTHPWVRKRVMWMTLASLAFAIAFLGYDLISYRPQFRSILQDHASQVLEWRDSPKTIIEDQQGDSEQLSGTGAETDSQNDAKTETPTEVARRAVKGFSAQLDAVNKQHQQRLRGLTRTALYFWGPFALIVIFANSFSDDVVNELEKRAPDLE